jgi:glyoxylase-like metal-dependent hydrolase (beta-lactamase superfamily II)/rhodanese-related sulfurtransferase
VNVVVIETPELGDRTYLVHDGEVAIVVDPQRDTDRVVGQLESLGLTLSMVCETHLHNDYVTGGLELAQRYGVTYLVGGGHEALYECQEPQDGQTFEVGTLQVLAVSTPGHTEGHLSYVVSAEGCTPSVFTGGSMLFGTVGRTDLVDPEATDRLTRSQYHSTRRLANELDGLIDVQPTHGFGSFCSAASSSGSSTSTIANERVVNIACTTEDEDQFVDTLLSGLTAYPRYYAHMGPLNRSGMASPFVSELPPKISKQELERRIQRKEWVIDLRDRQAYADRHIVGTLGIEHNNSFTTYLGWVVPWGMPLTVLAESEKQILNAQRDLARIGIDRFAAAVFVEEALGWNLEEGSYPVRTFSDLAAVFERDSSPRVLDVRRIDEWAIQRLESAQHIPLQDLLKRHDEVSSSEQIWVHCAAGFRASIAAGLLHREGRNVVLIDDAWENASREGLPLE